MIFETSPGFLALAFLVAFPYLTTALPIESRQFEELDVIDLEARQGALSCHPVNIDQIKTLAAWNKIEQYAKDNYGEGGVNIVANPSEYPDRQLQACMKGGKIPVQFAEKPQCTTDRKNIDGKSIGTNSEIEFTTKTGISQTSSWTVTHSSTLTAGVKFGVTVGVPGIGASAETYMETTIHNERSTSFEGKNEHEETVKMKFSNKAGDKCKMELVTQMCTATAKGRAPVVASGFVWFNYEDKRAPKSGGDAHYKYSINIDSILSEDERTSFIEFQGPMNSKSSTTYNTNCSKDKGPAKKPGDKKPNASKNPGPGKGKPAPGKPAPKPAPGKPVPKPKPAPKKPTPKPKPATKPGKPAPRPAGKPTKKR